MSFATISGVTMCDWMSPTTMNDWLCHDFSNLDGFWSSFQLIMITTYFTFSIGWFFMMSLYFFYIVYTFNCTCNQSSHIIVA
jgi:hypothetical protein